MPHDMMPLDVLVHEIIEDNLRDQMVFKEKEFDQQYKVLVKANENYDDDTTELVQRLNNQRQAQVQAINEKYEQLERDLVEKRKTKKEEMEEIMEEHVLKKWTTLKNQRLKLESKLESSHQVDLLRGYRELKDDVKEILDIKLPELKLVELVTRDECRDVEIKSVLASENLCLECLSTVEKRKVSVQLPHTPSSSYYGSRQRQPSYISHLKPPAKTLPCCYGDDIYVGLSDNTVAKINCNYRTQTSYPCKGTLLAVSVNESYIYTLSYHAEVPEAPREYGCARNKPTSSRHEVRAHYRSPSSDTVMTSFDPEKLWTYSTGQPCGELDMCATSGYLAITDRVHNTITACQLNHDYSVIFNAQQRKSHFSGTYVAQCIANENSIVLMTRVDLKRLASFKVSQVDLSTGNFVWTYVHYICCGPKLLALTPYANNNLLITSDQFKVMFQLDIKTGKKVCEFVVTNKVTQETQSDSAGKLRMKGLVSANNLLVTVEPEKIQYYEMKSM